MDSRSSSSSSGESDRQMDVLIEYSVSSLVDGTGQGTGTALGCERTWSDVEGGYSTPLHLLVLLVFCSCLARFLYFVQHFFVYDEMMRTGDWLYVYNNNIFNFPQRDIKKE